MLAIISVGNGAAEETIIVTFSPEYRDYQSQVTFFVLAEERKRSVLPVRDCVERTSTSHGHIIWIVIFILHIVGEWDELYQIKKLCKCSILQSPVDHSVEFLLDSALIVRLLYFQKCQRHAVKQNIDIRAEGVFLRVLLNRKRQFINYSKIVIFDAVKVYQLYIRCCVGLSSIERSAKIII